MATQEVASPAQDTPQVEVPAGSSFNREAPDGPAVVPGTDTQVAALPTPQVAAPSVSQPETPSIDTAPAGQPPQASQAPGAPATPDQPGADGTVAVTTDTGVAPAGQGAAPTAPGAEDTPATPSAPSAPAASPSLEGNVTETGQAPALPSAPSAQPSLQGQTTGLATPQADSTPSTEAAPKAPRQDTTPRIVTAGQGDDQPSDGPQIRPAPNTAATQNAPQVTTNRLPRIGDASQEAAAVEEDVPTPQLLPAIDAFAVPFENPEAKPVMAVVLMDQTPRPTAEQLALFPFPVTFVIDPLAPDAAQAMRLYRDAGFEVAMLVSLADGTQPTDIEVAMQAHLAAVPEAVAVMDAEGSALGSSRDLATQMSEILAETGHGLLTFSKGLNATRQVAEREGVPVKLVFRSFDANGESAQVIRRFMDQAAFRAGQEAGVVMLGQAKPDTIATLVEWGVQGRANSVALAPLSAALKAQ